MREPVFSIGVVFVALTLLSCAQQPTPVAEEPVSTEADVAAIENLTSQVMKAVNEGDLGALMATIADDAVEMPPGVPALIGKEAIRKFYDSDEAYDITISSYEIEVCGDWAFQRASWKGSWIQKDSGETTQFESKDMLIYKRQPNGSWKISHAIWNFTDMVTTEK